MNSKNQSTKVVEAASGTGSHKSLPKLTVEEIIKKFVTPSSHRTLVQLSEPATKKK